mmetsp:Transcript_100574/g.181543  ORF Transcript_100574/g.181543 Transcript_100574/m.181543 type:complete len:261 (+) Transcript_100574:44-826(+)
MALRETLSELKQWKPLLLIAGSAVAIAGVAYYLLSDEPEEDEATAGGGKLSKEGGPVRQVLTEMVTVEELAKKTVNDLVQEMAHAGTELSLEETYKRIEAAQLWDPLEKYGLTMQDFEEMITDFQHDPFVMQAMARLAGSGPEGPTGAPPPQQVATLAQVVEAKAFMLAEIEAMVDSFTASEERKSWNARSAGMALQTQADAKAEKKFGISSQDLEFAMLQNQQKLGASAEFMDVMMKTQDVMRKFIGSLAGSSAKGDVD